MSIKSIKLSENYMYVFDEHRVYHVVLKGKRKILKIEPVLFLSRINNELEIIYLKQIPTGIVKKAVNLFNRVCKEGKKIEVH